MFLYGCVLEAWIFDNSGETLNMFDSILFCSLSPISVHDKVRHG